MAMKKQAGRRIVGKKKAKRRSGQMAAEKSRDEATAAQRDVVEYFLADPSHNQTRAYLEVHRECSYESARTLAARMFANVRVQKYLKARQAEIAARLRITSESVLSELAKLANVNASDFFEWGPWGGRLKDSAALPAEMKAAVAEVSETRTKEGGNVRLKFHSKTTALDLLTKILGMQKPQEPEKAEAPRVHLNVTFVSPDGSPAVPDGVKFVQPKGQVPDGVTFVEPKSQLPEGVTFVDETGQPVAPKVS